MTWKRTSVTMSLALLLAGCAGRTETPCESCAEGKPATAATEIPDASRPDEEHTMFAEIRMQVTGCMACAHCRDAMRKIARQLGSSVRVEFIQEGIRVAYLKPQPLDIPELVRRLEASGIIGLRVREVFLTSTGRLQGDGPEKGRWSIDGTGQAFPVSGAARASSSRPSLLVARVLDFQTGDRLRLELSQQ